MSLEKQNIHVLPVNDLKPHIESAACKCQPRVEPHTTGNLIIHNAYDGREFYEVKDDSDDAGAS